MANWKYRLNLKDLWESREAEEISLKEMGMRITERIKKLPCYKKYEDELEDIAMNFKCINEDVEEFDGALEKLYDWADCPLVTRRGEMQRKLCWVATF